MAKVPIEAEIYRNLPGVNCGDCGVPTCAEFAKKLITGEKDIYQCTRFKDERKRETIILILDEYFE